MNKSLRATIRATVSREWCGVEVRFASSSGWSALPREQAVGADIQLAKSRCAVLCQSECGSTPHHYAHRVLKVNYGLY